MATPSDDKFCFKDLPVDLIRSIFEAAAEDEHKPNWACARVSKAVHSWVAPRLYRHVFVRDAQILFLLHRTLEPLLKISHPRPEYDFQRVQHAWRGVQTLHFGLCKGFNSMLEILSVSSAASSIVISQWPLEGETDDTKVGVHPVWDILRPKRLFLPSKHFSPTRRHFRSSDTPMFTNLTHFEMQFVGSHDPSAWEWASLAGLQNLTHLSIIVHMLVASDVAEALPHLPPSLLAFIVNVCAEWRSNPREIIQRITRGKNGPFDDDRVVVAIDENSYWKEGAVEEGKWDDVLWRNLKFEWRHADEGFWAKADAMISRRREERLR
ncbi:hypothetical protein DFP72DRAFT_313970 [Ephemerocybe angulata]|uniref:F-box domain-containing protein n=1 Tax=Ephemerocybe angulata TaxID=980116 RepID=A0A8H6M7F1_9AGAR|nr:hypothetical protein DFP72DRAFT_313970 [Tulosesus angulatus]